MKKIIFFLIVAFQFSLSQYFSNGFNFNITPQDTSTNIFLPHFPMKAIGKTDFVSIDVDGNFSVAGNKIRFFGTNLTADGAFPNKAKSWFIAGHMRKMGFNLVRMHHLDNPWSTQSIFEWGKDTRHLNSVTLDRMENLISDFKKNGIYINMNLHVSRTFRAQDGVANYDSLPEFGKAVNYFDPQIISLHKEYAKQLLTHTNPYTGKSLVNDPVMAMVEITNENSLYRFWRDNLLKINSEGGVLPLRHVIMLDSLFNIFLQNKYSTTSNLQAAWNLGIVDRTSSNQIRNGGFESGIASQWMIEKSGTVQATTNNEITNVYKGSLSGKVVVTQTNGTDWHIQFKQIGLTMYKDSIYTITFAARSDSTRSISVTIMKETSPWTWYSGMSVQLTPQWKTYSLTLRAPETVLNEIRLSFGLGAQKGTYWFDEVTMMQPSTKGLLTDESLEQKNIRRIDFSECAGFSDQRVKDISEFYIGVMKKYFAEMKSYLKDSLGVKVPIVGTNWNVGPADLSAMSELDYIDNHSYWDHPQFPTTPWSSTDWMINNTAMVTNNGGTIPGLFAGVPMKNKPYTISEYNHPFPNQYQSESVLFIASYASFHNADGIMFFDYNGFVDNWETDKVESYFNISRNTSVMSLIPSCAYAYRNGFISRYKTLIPIQYTKDTILVLPKSDGGGWIVPTFFLPNLALQNAVRTESYCAISTTNFPALPVSLSHPYTTDTKEIIWNTNGLLRVLSPKFVGISGMLNNFSNQQCGPLKLNSANNFGTLTWISLSDDSLQKSQRSLVTISTRIQNTNMVWEGTKTFHNNWGSSPTLMQPLQISLALEIFADSIIVYPLDVNGNISEVAKKYFPVSVNKYEITIDQTVSKTVWFGVEAFGKGITRVKNTENGIPLEYSFLQNYPNPFNPITTITYTVGTNVRSSQSNMHGVASVPTTVKIYDVLGREVKTLVNETLNPGKYSILFNAENLSAGIYFLRLQSGNFSAVKKLNLIK